MYVRFFVNSTYIHTLKILPCLNKCSMDSISKMRTRTIILRQNLTKMGQNGSEF
jgi:hypothetical protein